MKKNNNKIIITAIICIILMSIAIAQKKIETDTFYTIKIGEYISQNGITNLTEDPFSWIELPYTFPHWLYDFMMYEIYSIAGWLSIYISTIVFTAILGILIFILSYKKSKNEVLSGILSIIAIYLIRNFCVARAQILSYSIFILVILCIEEFLEKKKKRYAVILPILSLILVNIHMGVWPFMFVLFLPYFAENILIKILNIINKIKSSRKKKKYIEKNEYNFYKIKIKKNENIIALSIVMLICICMGMITPTGLSTPYTYLYKAMKGNTTNSIIEYSSANIEMVYQNCIIFFGMILLAFFTPIKLKIKNIFFYCGLITMALAQSRHYSLFIILITPIYTETLNEILNIYFKDHLNKTRKFINLLYTPIFIIMIMVIISYKIYRPKLITKYVSGRIVPIEATEWIKENLDYNNIRLFNEYNYGSYLLFNDIPVMIDNRAELYAPEFNTKTGKVEDGQNIFDDVVNYIEKNIDVYEYFEKYDIDYAIVCMNNWNLYNELENDKEHYEKVYPLEEKDIKQNNLFSIYKIYYESEEK